MNKLMNICMIFIISLLINTSVNAMRIGLVTDDSDFCPSFIKNYSTVTDPTKIQEQLDKTSKLDIACYHGNWENILQLLDKGVQSITHAGSQFGTLDFATLSGDILVVQNLLTYFTEKEDTFTKADIKNAFFTALSCFEEEKVGPKRFFYSKFYYILELLFLKSDYQLTKQKRQIYTIA